MSNIYQTHKPTESGGGLYLKVADGDTVKVRFASEPAIYDNEYEGKITTRYAWVVWNVELKVAQVLAQSGTFYKNLANIASDTDYGDPTGYDIKIKREGEMLETKYHLTPGRENYELGAEALAKVKEIDLLETLSKSPGASKISWLSEWDVDQTPKESGFEKAKAQFGKPDVAIEDISDEPIDLSEIPF